MAGQDRILHLNITRLPYTLADISLWAVPFITAALAITNVGLLGHNLQYVNVHANEALRISYPIEARLRWRPLNLGMDTVNVLLVACAVCTVGGILIGVLALVRQRPFKSISLDNPKQRSSRLLLTCAILDTLMIVLAFVATIYSRELWRADKEWRNYIKAEYIHDLSPGSPSGNVSYYRSPFYYNPVGWNCRLGQVLSWPDRRQLLGLCQEGIAAIHIMVPLLIFQGIMLVSHLWAWRVEGKSAPWYQTRSESEEQIVRPAEGSE